MTAAARLPILSFCLIGILLAGCKKSPTTEKPTIVVSNTYLAAAAQDLCGDAVQIVCLAPPGSCPGHFDLRPAQARQIRQSRAILAFDFQTPVGDIAAGAQAVYKTIAAPQGLCIPDSYLSVVRQTAAILATVLPDRAEALAARQAEIDGRLNALDAECRRSIESAGLKNVPALVWSHQAAFAQWLGLDVAATVAGGEMSVAQTADLLETARQKKVIWVIGNQQQSRQLAEKLAAALQARAAVFSNFPDFSPTTPDLPAFDAMVRNNLTQLTAAQ